MKLLKTIIAMIVALLCVAAIGFAVQSLPVHQPEPEQLIMIVTAYCPCEKCCGKWADGITASGHRIAPGDKFVAAPPWIPFGTLLSIPGYSDEPVPVLDRGSAIRGNKIDVFFNSHNAALEWGVQELEITVYERAGAK